MIADAQTVLLLSAVISIILGLMMVINWRTRKTYRGFGWWVAACFVIGCGYALIAAQGLFPPQFSVFLGNTLHVVGLVLIFEGIQLFFGRKVLDLWNLAILGACVVGQGVLIAIRLDDVGQIPWIAASMLVINLRIALTMLREAPAKLRRTSQTLGSIFLLAAGIALLRGVSALLYPQTVSMASSSAVAVTNFASISGMIIWTFYLYFLNNARIEVELQETQQNLVSIAEADRYKVIRLGLLEETSRFLAESLDENEIARRTVSALIRRFGYAEAAISLVVEGDLLELVAIDGTEDVGFPIGYRQKIGEGIMGYTAEQKLPYIAADVEKDPYYFTIGRRSGSAACVPILAEGQVLGVLYVETTVRNAFDQMDIQTLETLGSSAVTAIQKARLYQRVQDQLRAITTLQSASHTILSSLELSQIFQSVVDLLKQVYNYSFVSIYLLQGQVLHMEAQVGYQEERAILWIPVSSGVMGRCVQQKQLQFIPDVSRDADFLQAASEIGSEICVPLIKDDQVLGVLNVEEAPGHPLTGNDVAVLAALAGPVVIAVENARLHAQVKELALLDGLTGLFNRRAFDQILDNELERAIRYQYPLALVIIDLDSFKAFNDRWGHPAGDERLKEIAGMLRSDLRNPDVVARYGGDEFALILPHTDKERALSVAERLRACAETCSPAGQTPHPWPSGITFSMGIAVYPDDAHCLKELLFKADQAELAAKAAGKNRIYLAEQR